MPTRAGCSQPQERWLTPLLEAYLRRATLHALLRAQGVRLYWRTLTPLVVLWGLLYQRLAGGVPLDAVVCALHAGDADGLDADDPHPEPLSVRLRSVRTAAYNQGRQRLPLGLIRAVRERLSAQALAELVPVAAHGAQGWRGHAVRWLDGTTFRLPPAGDLPDTYGQARGKCGTSHGVTAQAVVSFCWASWLVVGQAESAHVPVPKRRWCGRCWPPSRPGWARCTSPTAASPSIAPRRWPPPPASTCCCAWTCATCRAC